MNDQPIMHQLETLDILSVDIDKTGKDKLRIVCQPKDDRGYNDRKFVIQEMFFSDESGKRLPDDCDDKEAFLSVEFKLLEKDEDFAVSELEPYVIEASDFLMKKVTTFAKSIASMESLNGNDAETDSNESDSE